MFRYGIFDFVHAHQVISKHWNLIAKKINIFKLLIIKLISMFDICISIYIIIVIIITTTIIIIIIITMKSEK